MTKSGKRARALRHLFTGRNKSKRIKIEVPDHVDLPSDLTVLGKCISVVYREAKRQDGGRSALYEHTFTPSSNAVITATPQGRGVLIILGDFSVVEEGIADRSELEELGYEVG